MASRKVLRAGTRIDLPDLTSRLFFALAEASPKPVSAEQLSAEVWDGGFVSDETIAQRVKLLRQALGDSARTPRYIETMRGRGYRLVPGKVVERRPVWHMAAVLVAGALLAAVVVWNMSEGSGPNRAENVAPADEASIERVLAQAERYLATRRADDVDAAINLFCTALESWPNENQSRIGLSFALSTRATKISGEEADAVEAEALARHVVEAEPHNDEAWHALAYALDAQAGWMMPSPLTCVRMSWRPRSPLRHPAQPIFLPFGGAFMTRSNWSLQCLVVAVSPATRTRRWLRCWICLVTRVPPRAGGIKHFCSVPAMRGDRRCHRVGAASRRQRAGESAIRSATHRCSRD